MLCRVHAEKSGHSPAGIGGSGAHCVGLGAEELGRGVSGVPESCGGLQLLQFLRVRLHGAQAGNADIHNFQAPGFPPFFAENGVQGVRQFQCVHLQSAVADAHFGDPAKSRTQSAQKLASQLAVQLVPGVGGGDVAADILIEQHGVADAVGEHAEAPDAHIHVKADVVVHHPEGHGAGSAVFVARQLLGVEVVHPLVPGSFPAKGEPAAQFQEGFLHPFSQISAENGGSGGGVVGILSRLGGEFHNFSLIHDHHALPVGHHDHGAGGDDVVISLIATPLGHPPALHRQHVRVHGVAPEKFLPLIRQHPAGSIQTRTNKTHNPVSFS